MLLARDRAPCLEAVLRPGCFSRTPDGHLEVWLLYRPEPFAFDSDDERSIHQWVRRCDVFTSKVEAITFLDNLIGAQVQWRPYDELFPELWIGMNGRQRWLLEAAPLNPPGRRA